MEIVFRKSGNFYSVYDDDAKILHHLFKYKIKENRVGFPINSLEKVTNKLDELHINYRINDEKKVFNDNSYDNYLIESENKILLDNKVLNIEEKINNLDLNKLNNLIELIDNYLSE